MQTFEGSTVHETGSTRQFHQGYRLEAIIGKGGQATVYQGRDLSERSPHDATVAVKLLKPFETTDEKRLFEFEGQRTSKWRHPHILPTYSYGVGSITTESTQVELPMIVMPLAEGGSVSQRLARLGRLPLVEAVHLIYQATLGVEYAHERKTVHRDLKPANLLIRNNEAGPHVQVSDFGIAVNLHDLHNNSITPQSNIGSPPYLSPEQIEGRAIRQSDIYSMGVIAYELTTGQRPFTANSMPGYVRAHLFEPPPAFEALPGLHITDALAAIEPIILRTLNKEPGDRYPTMGQFGQELIDAYTAAAHRMPDPATYVDLGGRAVGRARVGPERTKSFKDDKTWLQAYDALIGQVNNAQDEIQRLETLVEQLRTDASKTKAESGKHASQHREALRLIRALQQELQSEKADSEKQKEQHQQAIATARSKIAQLLQEKEVKDTELSQQKQRIRRLERSVGTAEPLPRRQLVKTMLSLGGWGAAGFLGIREFLDWRGEKIALEETEPELAKAPEFHNMREVTSLINQLLGPIKEQKGYWSMHVLGKTLAPFMPGISASIAAWFHDHQKQGDEAAIGVALARYNPEFTQQIKARIKKDFTSLHQMLDLALQPNPKDIAALLAASEKNKNYSAIDTIGGLAAAYATDQLVEIIKRADRKNEDVSGWLPTIARNLIPYHPDFAETFMKELENVNKDAWFGLTGALNMAMHFAPYYPSVAAEARKRYAKKPQSLVGAYPPLIAMSLTIHASDIVKEAEKASGVLYGSWLSVSQKPGDANRKKKAFDQLGTADKLIGTSFSLISALALGHSKAYK